MDPALQNITIFKGSQERIAGWAEMTERAGPLRSTPKFYFLLRKNLIASL